MKPEEIHLSDWSRIIFGQVPPTFYLELVIRAILVYILLMTSMRFLGKRMSTQTSRLELAAMVALASAIGVPMLSYDRGILPAFIIAAIVVGITRLISQLSFNNQHIEQVTQGDLDSLVEDGVMHYDTMKKVRVTPERLMAQLRSENLFQLGQVKRLYMEANGSFTIVINNSEKPGLSVIPNWDKEFSEKKLQTTDLTICGNCGAEKPESLSRLNGEGKCFNCGEKAWTKAVTKA